MKKRKKNVVRRECDFFRRIKIILHFPHAWVCIILAGLAVIMLAVSSVLDNCGQAFWSSICANVFAGLVTGLAICLIGGAKQISTTKMHAQRQWLQHLADMLKTYMDDYHKLIRLRFEKFDGNQDLYDFYYDMCTHANDINVAIHQGAFNKALSFNPEKFCRKVFNYDAVAVGKKCDDLHEYVRMIDIDCPGSKEIAAEFGKVHPELMRLNSAVYSAIKDLDIRLSEMNKSII